MKRLFGLLLLGGCVFSPCVPIEIQVIRLSDGAVLAPDARASYESCVLTTAEPYHEWTRFGIGASLETWECGC